MIQAGELQSVFIYPKRKKISLTPQEARDLLEYLRVVLEGEAEYIYLPKKMYVTAATATPSTLWATTIHEVTH